MRFKYLLNILFAFIYFTSDAQNFYRSYGNTDDEVAKSVVETKDSAFFIFGTSSSFVNGTSNFYLLKIDSTGTFNWSKTYGGSGIEQGHSISLKPNGHYLLTGYSNSYGNGGYDILNIEIDSLGNEIWNNSYGGTDWDFAYDNTILLNGDAIISGSTHSIGNGNLDAYVMRIDNNGDSLWIKNYGSSGDDVIYRTILTSDNYIIGIGSTTTSNGDKDIFLLKMDENGDTLWTKTFGTTLNDEGFEIKETNTGNYLICGYIEAAGLGKEGYYFETDTIGTVLWTQVYGGANEETFNALAIKTGENRFYAARETSSFGNGEYDFGVKGLSIFGGWYISGNTYGTLMTEKPYDMIYTSHHRILTVGYTDYPSGNQNVMAVLSDSLFPYQPTLINYIDVTSVIENEISNFSIYPNPASDIIYFSENNLVSFSIHDISGQLFLQKNEMINSIDISDLSSGIYILSVKTSENKFAKIRLVIAR